MLRADQSSAQLQHILVMPSLQVAGLQLGQIFFQTGRTSLIPYYTKYAQLIQHSLEFMRVQGVQPLTYRLQVIS